MDWTKTDTGYICTTDSFVHIRPFKGDYLLLRYIVHEDDQRIRYRVYGRRKTAESLLERASHYFWL